MRKEIKLEMLDGERPMAEERLRRIVNKLTFREAKKGAYLRRCRNHH